MDFEFNEQQQMFRETFQRFLADNYGLEVHAARINDPRTDARTWSHLSELGLFSMMTPEEFGGLGLKVVDVALVIEELGKALIDPSVFDTLVCSDLLARYGSEAQKSRWLPRMASGDLRVVTAVSEPHSGFGLEHLTTSVSGPHGQWRLDGTKILVPDAKSADVILLAARALDGQLGLVLLEQSRAGIHIDQHVTLDPTCSMSRVTCSGVRVSNSDWLGENGPLRAAAERLLNLSSTLASLQMVGIAGKVLDQSVAYAAQRVQFGKPIGSFQAIKHKCADMAVAVDASRSAAYFAAWSVAEAPDACAKAASIAKSLCGDTLSSVCNDGTQIHGGMGFTWELGLHFYLRRAVLLEYSSGDSAYHRERVLEATLHDLQLVS